ncbi:MAG: FecR domain-containing protein [Bacteroidetes bacterium]|nr:FecR domain-containing protein [Bacteroidota bacterium]
MRISKQLIELVLSGGGSEEDEELVRSFFREHPEKLAQYLTEGSWDGFEVDMRQGAPREKMLGVIERKVGKVQGGLGMSEERDGKAGDGGADPGRAEDAGRTPERRLSYGWVAAAAAVLVVVWGIRLLSGSGSSAGNVKPVSVAAPVVAAATGGLKTIENSSLKAQFYTLPDGSKVKLSGKSKISYSNPYVDNRRDIYLEGEGVFTVAKEKARPFAVHAGNIVTTALGTVFRVSDRGKPVTTVQLYSGRVVVRGKSFSDVYLQPGEQVLMNSSNFTVEVKKEDPKVAAGARPQPVVLNFTKESLAEIFDQLQKECTVTISYDAVNLRNTEFTGVFNSGNETLESFLSTVCEINELTLIRTAGKSFSIQAK